ncbi:hypothetical protein CPter91_4262 [Collimonas pratensis]|uniref:Uncharacterized protein n=1 Tax=Collimonas pratensis TaxID=279113 RepID=A0A127Q9N2_9BURK|nr:hypothetical protein CPter91_4262 [Collimonas pratensis]
MQTRFIRHNVPAAEGFELSGFTIDRDADIDVALVAFFGCLSKRVFERTEHNIPIDVFFMRERIDQQ